LSYSSVTLVLVSSTPSILKGNKRSFRSYSDELALCVSVLKTKTMYWIDLITYSSRHVELIFMGVNMILVY
jgi:hypothetical protein